LAAAIAPPCVGCASVTRGDDREHFHRQHASRRNRRNIRTRNSDGLPHSLRRRGQRNADITVTINKEGYEPQIIPLTKEIPGTGAAGFAGNLLAGGLIGMGVDAATGAAQDHKPNPVIVTLQPRGRDSARAGPRPPRQPPPQS